MAFLLCLLGGFLYWETPDGRVAVALGFLAGALNPLWGIYALVVVAPLSLVDPSSSHMLCVLEAVVLGILFGGLRERWGGGAAWLPGAWGHWAAGLVLVLLAASWGGWLAFHHRDISSPEKGFTPALFFARTFYGPATEPHWTPFLLWKWVSALLLAGIVWRRTTPLLAARWLKLAGLSLVVVSLLAILDWVGLMDFTHLRRANPDPLHQGRLQGPAGHAGWFAQWIVLAWPGLALWWAVGKRKRNALVGLAAACMLLVLFLTGARASWLGVAAAAALTGGLPWLGRRLQGRVALVLPAILGLLILLGALAGGGVLGQRMKGVLRFQDRANYYVSSWQLLSERPLGWGLGMHSRAYESRFSPYWTWYQSDHVTAHSLWLHTLVEGGPFLPLLLAIGVAGVAVEWRRRFPLLDGDTRRTAAALLASLAGLFVVSFMQFVFYIRAIELMFWVAGGLFLGLCRPGEEIVHEKEIVRSRWLGRGVLLFCGTAAVFMMLSSGFRFDPSEKPRQPAPDPEGKGLTFWTSRSWRTALGPEEGHLHFSLMRRATPANVRIRWPDGEVETLVLAPEQWRYFERPVEADPSVGRFAPQRWLHIDAVPGWVPAHELEDSGDQRELGVYLHQFRFERERGGGE